MPKALYRKWRPQSWDEVAGQEHITQTLRNAVMLDRVAHAYLFSGPRGTGKTTCARLVAKAVNCLNPDLKNRPCNECEHCKAITAGRFMDLIEIDAASNTSVDDVRDLRDKINFSPSQGRFKVYIIDEVHMLSTAAFNALLKTLEEPPAHAIFVLATTEIHKIPATVLSRCQRHEFRRIPIEIIVNYLKEKSQAEGLKIEEPVFMEVARQATGSLRDAISLLDQLTSTEEEISLEMAQTILGTATSLRVIEIVDALVANDAAAGLEQIDQALDTGTDPRQLARQVVSYLRNVLLYQMGHLDQTDIPDDIKPKIHAHASQLSLPELLKAVNAFNQATVDEQSNWHPGLGLELAFTEYLVEPVVMAEKAPTPQTHPKSTTPVQPQQTQPKPKPKSEPVQTPVEEKPVDSQKSEPQLERIKEEERVQPKQESTEQETSESKPTKPAVEGDLKLSDIHKQWRKVKSMVGKHNPRTEGLLNTSKVVGLKDNTLILGFTSDTLKDMMDKGGNLTLTADILEEVFGTPINVNCIVSTHESSAVPDDIEIDNDGMVGTATRDLGGKITKAKEAD
ncbi:MAG: DNA polymerase III subunit gamma/tau [Anaerolineaceae bacterium]|nr:DNA polymerase III subunit gamma/tau [Anaerolineaceae bacterium]